MLDVQILKDKFSKGIIDLSNNCEVYNSNLLKDFLKFIEENNIERVLDNRFTSVTKFLEAEIAVIELLDFLNKKIFEVNYYNQFMGRRETHNFLDLLSNFVKNKVSPFEKEVRSVFTAIEEIKKSYEEIREIYSNDFSSINVKRLVIEKLKRRKRSTMFYIRNNSILNNIQSLKENFKIIENFMNKKVLEIYLKHFELDNKIFYITDNETKIKIYFIQEDKEIIYLYKVNLNKEQILNGFSYSYEKFLKDDKVILLKYLPEKMAKKLSSYYTLSI